LPKIPRFRQEVVIGAKRETELARQAFIPAFRRAADDIVLAATVHRSLKLKAELVRNQWPGKVEIAIGIGCEIAAELHRAVDACAALPAIADPLRNDVDHAAHRI